MSRRKDRGRTPGLWIATNELPSTGGHPFYQRLNYFLDAHGFDDFVEAQCAPFYAATVGRPSVMPGTYFRLLRREAIPKRAVIQLAYAVSTDQESTIPLVSNARQTFLSDEREQSA